MPDEHIYLVPAAVTEPSTNEFLPASHNQSDDSSSERRERQYERTGVLDDRRKSVEDGASASHGANGVGRVVGARDIRRGSRTRPSGPRHGGRGEGRRGPKK